MTITYPTLAEPGWWAWKACLIAYRYVKHVNFLGTDYIVDSQEPFEASRWGV